MGYEIKKLFCGNFVDKSICHAEAVFEIGADLPSADSIAAFAFSGDDDAVLAEFLDGFGVILDDCCDLFDGVASVLVELYRAVVLCVHLQKISMRKFKESFLSHSEELLMHSEE